MKFKPYKSEKYSKMEYKIIDFWKKNKIFEQSVEFRPKQKSYVFYDGPPFITGLPHHGSLLPSIAKDVIPRFKTMNGYRVERRWGWDCHGLPAENLVEEILNLPDKRAILDFGVENFINACRENMTAKSAAWEDLVDRIGRWVEFKGAYKTMDKDYMESIWWTFKQLYDKGKIYEGEKVLVFCTRCSTPISKSEVAMDNSYKDVKDPSIYVKFKVDRQGENWPEGWPELVTFLAWTTTPWTLPANTGLAVNPKLNYSLVVDGSGEYFLVGSDLVDKIFTNQSISVKSEISGQDLANLNLRYQPLLEDHGEAGHRVVAADFVTVDEGSGLVQMAPAYGEEDYMLSQETGLPIVRNLDDAGCYKAGPWKGRNAWEANEDIISHLQDKKLIYRVEIVKHSYPHCHRCQTRLIYKIHPSWFLDIQSQKDKMIEHNQPINWVPGHIKTGRFPNTVLSAPDWGISRDRFWATPIPVWRGQDDQGNTKTIVVGSYQELTDLSGQTLEDYHRPFVDKIQFEKDGIVYKRIDQVMDCWFESGSMPFAQYHYPFENKEVFEENSPSDYIIEYVGQVRAGFIIYTPLASPYSTNPFLQTLLSRELLVDLMVAK